MRRKLDNQTCEETAARACVLLAIVEELLLASPVARGDLNSEIIQPWRMGDDHIDMEIQAAMIDQSETFNPAKDLPSVKRVLDAHIFKTALSTETIVNKEDIAADDFSLLLKQLAWDIDAYKVWVMKCSSVKSARYRKQQDWKVSRKNTCDKCADKFLTSCVKLVVFDDKPERNIAAVMDYKRDHIRPKLVGQGSGDIPQVLLVNWTVPSLIPHQYQNAQTTLVTWGLNENMSSVGIVLYPVYTNQAGKLHLEEGKATSMLTKGHHNLDYTFSLMFKNQKDRRDQRPLVYPGRMIFPSPCKLDKHIFFGCELRRLRHTEAVEQLQPKMMRDVEDLYYQHHMIHCNSSFTFPVLLSLYQLAGPTPLYQLAGPTPLHQLAGLTVLYQLAGSKFNCRFDI